jgi:hypothetical protein
MVKIARGARALKLVRGARAATYGTSGRAGAECPGGGLRLAARTWNTTGPG